MTRKKLFKLTLTSSWADRPGDVSNGVTISGKSADECLSKATAAVHAMREEAVLEEPESYAKDRGDAMLLAFSRAMEVRKEMDYELTRRAHVESFSDFASTLRSYAMRLDGLYRDLTPFMPTV